MSDIKGAPEAALTLARGYIRTAEGGVYVGEEIRAWPADPTPWAMFDGRVRQVYAWSGTLTLRSAFKHIAENGKDDSNIRLTGWGAGALVTGVIEVGPLPDNVWSVLEKKESAD